jgi:heptosyltransferase-2
LLTYELPALERLKVEQFDLLISLDKEDEAIALAVQVCAKKKIGFGLDAKTGNILPLNKESRYAFQLGLSDELKFKQNQKSYPQIIFEMAGLKYQNDEYILNISDKDKAYAQELFTKIDLPQESLVIGLNTGAGDRFVNKAWTEDGFVALIRMLQGNLKTPKIFLLGGPQEIERNRRIASKAGNFVYDIGCQHTLGQFCAIVQRCSLLVSGDTTALHIAIALKKPVVAIFGSTCEQEIELYGQGVKIFSSIDCRPCYKKECDRPVTCMTLIEPQEVFQAIRKLLSL